MTVRADDLFIPLDGSDEFKNCPLFTPDDADGGSFTSIDQRFPARELFDRSKGLIVVVAKKTWTGKIAADHGTATTTTRFTVRLRRAR